MNLHILDVYKRQKEYLEKLNIEINDRQEEQFVQYMNLLVEWNEKMNLTAITEREQVFIKHFADSLTPLMYFDFKGKSVIDVGTGAGFPGLQMCIRDRAKAPHIKETGKVIKGFIPLEIIIADTAAPNGKLLSTVKSGKSSILYVMYMPKERTAYIRPCSKILKINDIKTLLTIFLLIILLQ